MIYRFFLAFLAPRRAALATALVYYLTLLAIVVSLPTTQVAFRYLGL